MPQFDQVTFFNQVFWFFFGFFFFYFITVYFFLPFLSENLKYRKKKLENNLFMLIETGFEKIIQYLHINTVLNITSQIMYKTFYDISFICLNTIKNIKLEIYKPLILKNIISLSLIKFFILLEV